MIQFKKIYLPHIYDIMLIFQNIKSKQSNKIDDEKFQTRNRQEMNKIQRIVLLFLWLLLMLKLIDFF